MTRLGGKLVQCIHMGAYCQSTREILFSHPTALVLSLSETSRMSVFDGGSKLCLSKAPCEPKLLPGSVFSSRFEVKDKA